MIVHVLAVDYDGTIAAGGRVADTTAAALARVRESGRRTALVTGRVLSELRRVCPGLDAMFDAVVAENGALLYLPATGEVRRLGEVPEPALLEALHQRGVEFRLGASIIASQERFADGALAAIRETGIERTLVFNKGELMLLPGGVTKGTGFQTALAELELSHHNAVGVGDAENDHAFLSLCECAVAVADAIPALRRRADYVTRAPNGAGVTELVDEHVLNDLSALVPGLARHRLALDDGAGPAAVQISAHQSRVLVVGPPASGKASLAGHLVARLAAARRSLCLLDPEGDYRVLAEMAGVVILGGRARQALPAAGELGRFLARPDGRLVLDLSALAMQDKVHYATEALAAVAAVQAANGLPHWLVVHSADHVLGEGSSALRLLPMDTESVCLITRHPASLARDIRRRINAITSTDLAAFWAGLQALGVAGPAEADAEPLAPGQAIFAVVEHRPPCAVRFRLPGP